MTAVRTDFLVFGSVTTSRPWMRWWDFVTEIVERERLMPAGVSASGSPTRRPHQYKISKAVKESGLSMIASAKARYSSLVQNFISLVLLLPIFSTHVQGLLWRS